MINSPHYGFADLLGRLHRDLAFGWLRTMESVWRVSSALVGELEHFGNCSPISGGRVHVEKSFRARGQFRSSKSVGSKKIEDLAYKLPAFTFQLDRIQGVAVGMRRCFGQKE